MESELCHITDTLPGLIWTAGPDGNIDFVNQRWCEYTGLSIDEAHGRGWQMAIHTEDLPLMLERWKSILVSGQPGDMEARLRRLDGEYRCFLFRAHPSHSASGQIVQWCGVSIDIEDRKQAERTMRAHEHRFRLIFDGLPALVILMNPDGDLVHANRYCLEYFRATLEELQGRGQVHSYHPDDRPRVLAAWKNALETGHPYESEGRRRRADGVYRWFQTRGFPLRDPEGNIVFWYSLATDIDDQMRAETLLAGEKRLLEMVASGCSLPIVLDALCRLFEEVTSDCTCSVVLVDASGTRLQQGASPSLPARFTKSIEGRPVSVDYGPCAMAACLNEQVISSDIKSETRWGVSGWCEWALSFGLQACWSTPITSASGKVLGTFGLHYAEPAAPTPFQQNLIEQFTHLASIAIERAQDEDALKRSQVFLTEAERLSATGSFSLNPATGAHWWSQQTYRIFGVDPEAPPTFEVMRERVHPDDLALLNHGLDCARRGERFSMEFRLQMPDGVLKHLHVVAQAIDLAAADSFEFVGSVRDITERRQSEEALNQARSDLAHVARITSLGALAASIAHEVNQPLSGIITNANTCLRMLAANPPNIEGARATAQRTIRDGNRASDVITRLRALFSKKEAATEPVDLNDATREVLALLRSELQRNRVILREELDNTAPSVTGDRTQLQQVILNLMRNASDAMRQVNDRPRTLLVKTDWDDGESVRLTVQDAGVGFKSMAVERLFDAFFTTKSDGMGIGLSVSRSIIESHQGRLWAEPNLDVGATFSFSIPRHTEHKPRNRSLDAIRQSAAMDPQRIMKRL